MKISKCCYEPATRNHIQKWCESGSVKLESIAGRLLATGNMRGLSTQVKMDGDG